ncbi:hypothetical protein BJ878DRAFT_42359 [Calycina marina]|uniref:Uncharacterized protein n=1 Tax=Calycina marina TaxID=1763456 RepID=A0A9P8CFQ5_9HELO|nr:hypothetical protein BJ878DRAFT_42359 [Calycina marina]
MLVIYGVLAKYVLVNTFGHVKFRLNFDTIRQVQVTCSYMYSQMRTLLLIDFILVHLIVIATGPFQLLRPWNSSKRNHYWERFVRDWQSHVGVLVPFLVVVLRIPVAKAVYISHLQQSLDYAPAILA